MPLVKPRFAVCCCDLVRSSHFATLDQNDVIQTSHASPMKAWCARAIEMACLGMRTRADERAPRGGALTSIANLYVLVGGGMAR